MFYESWLWAHSLSQGWTSIAFLDTALRVLRVIGDVQSVTYSISAAIDLKVWDCCRFIAWQKCSNRRTLAQRNTIQQCREALCTREKTQRFFPFHEGADITKHSTKRGSLEKYRKTSLIVKSKKKETDELTHKTKRLTDLENKLMVASGRDMGKGQSGSLGWT